MRIFIKNNRTRQVFAYKSGKILCKNRAMIPNIRKGITLSLGAWAISIFKNTTIKLIARCGRDKLMMNNKQELRSQAGSQLKVPTRCPSYPRNPSSIAGPTQWRQRTSESVSTWTSWYLRKKTNYFTLIQRQICHNQECNYKQRTAKQTTPEISKF